MNPLFLCLLLLPALAVAAPAAPASVLETTPRSALADAVARALEPAPVRAGGTTPRAAVLTDDNALGTLAVGTPAVVEAIVRAIETAESELLLQVYQWVDSDEAAVAVREAIDRRLAWAGLLNEPFRVGLLFGNAATPEFPLDVSETIAMLNRHAQRQPQLRIEVLAYDGTLFDILHSKTVIVDGAIAIVSTANFYTHGGPQKDSFNMAAHVRGPVVAALMQDWHHARHHARGLFQRHLDTTFYLPPEDTDWPTRKQQDANGEPHERNLPFQDEAGALQASVLSRPARNIFRYGGEVNPQAQGLLALLQHAQHHIIAINPALNIPSFKDALVEAIVERDVQVHLLLSFHMNRRRQHMLMGGDNSDTALDLYTRLLERGGAKAADRLQLYFGVDEMGALAPASHPGNVHAKVASIDGDALLIGSTNWDWPSYNSARELSVVLFGHNVGRTFEHDVFSQRLRIARPIQADDLPKAAKRKRLAAYRYLQGRPTAD